MALFVARIEHPGDEQRLVALRLDDLVQSGTVAVEVEIRELGDKLEASPLAVQRGEVGLPDHDPADGLAGRGRSATTNCQR